MQMDTNMFLPARTILWIFLIYIRGDYKSWVHAFQRWETYRTLGRCRPISIDGTIRYEATTKIIMKIMYCAYIPAQAQCLIGTYAMTWWVIPYGVKNSTSLIAKPFCYLLHWPL